LQRWSLHELGEDRLQQHVQFVVGGRPTSTKSRPAAHRFAHGARHEAGGLAVFDSYHPSRLNTNTGRLTPGMFEAVLVAVRAELGAPGTT
jgi:uracil-DNA glycosylase